MTIKTFKAGVLKTVNKPSVIVGGVPKEVKRVLVMKTVGDTQALRVAYTATTPAPPPAPTPPPVPAPPPAPPPAQPLAVTISPPDSSSGRQGSGNVSSEVLTASSNGVGPFTYSWSVPQWDSVEPPALSAPNAVATAISAYMYEGSIAYFTVRVAVQDSTGNVGTADATIYFWANERYYRGGGGYDFQGGVLVP